jgi:hypothetical protein
MATLTLKRFQFFCKRRTIDKILIKKNITQAIRGPYNIVALQKQNNYTLPQRHVTKLF